ncbi:MAG: hypothetical protein HC888_00755 [Candidatus Competibacteraceae bacterium]|nr:hypothetical protein [Candidatus Competibacteraceae bacterium]
MILLCFFLGIMLGSVVTSIAVQLYIRAKSKKKGPGKSMMASGSIVYIVSEEEYVSLERLVGSVKKCIKPIYEEFQGDSNKTTHDA